MSAKIGQIANVCHALSAVNININSTNTTYFDMSNYDRIMFAVSAGMSNAAGSLFTIEARESTTTNAVNSSSLAASITNVAIATNLASGFIEWRASEMNTGGGYRYAGARVYETNTRISTVSAIAIRTPARFPQATPLV